MTRLPQPGSDDGSWGDVLNDFLRQSHQDDGSLRSAALTIAGAYLRPAGGVPKTDLSAAAQASLDMADGSAQKSANLSDLGNTATALNNLGGARKAGGNTWSGPQSYGASTVAGATDLTISTAGRALYAKSTSITDHVASLYLANMAANGTAFAGGANNAALNVVSDNYSNSAMFLAGAEKNRGTLKIAHKGFADGSDASAAALSIDLQTSFDANGEPVSGQTGSKSQGLYLTSSTDISASGIAGNPISVRVTSGNEDFAVRGSGRTILGAPIGTTPQAQLDIRQPASGPAMFVQQSSGNTGSVLDMRDSNGTSRLSVDQNLNIVARRSVYAVVGLQVGGTSTTFGSGSGVLGMTDATTVPSTTPTGGITLYSQAGVLKYASSSGATVTLDGSGNAASSSGAVRQGLVGWTYDPIAAVNNSAVSAGQIVLMKVWAESSSNVGRVSFGLGNSPAGCANAYAGVYDASGVLRASSADISSALNGASPGLFRTTLSASYSVAAGSVYYVAFLVGSATTIPTLSRSASNGVINDGLTAGSYRTMTSGSGQTALPATLSLVTANVSSTAFYASISV